jgi:hypothetical protein
MKASHVIVATSLFVAFSGFFALQPVQAEQTDHCNSGEHELCVTQPYYCPADAYSECWEWYLVQWACNKAITGGTSGTCPRGSGVCQYSIECDLE